MIKNKKTKLIVTGGIFGVIAVLYGALSINKKIKKSKLQRTLENDKYFNGKIRDFGTLYLDNEKQKKPIDFLDFEDVSSYIGQKIEIRDTDKNHENKLSWVEINDNGKKLLICDRNILKEISWSDLNKQNLIFGKVVIIEGKKYILRLLTGYNESKHDVLNEWDRYIVNMDNLVGLPICSDYDKDNSLKENNKEKLSGDNNSLWNWCKFSSLTQSEYSKNQKIYIIRGSYSATYSDHLNKDSKGEVVGYRPALELVE